MYRLLPCLLASTALAACGGSEPPESAPTPESTAAPVETAPPPGIGATAYVGATIWDGTGGAPRPETVLLVRDGRIESVGEPVPEGADVIDLSGSWIVPGLINAHGHVSGRWAASGVTDVTEKIREDLRLYARYGITTVLSLGGAPAEAATVRAGREDPGLDYARLYMAGQVINDSNEQDAGRIAITNTERGVDWIKIQVDDRLGTTRKMSWDAVQVVMNASKVTDTPVAAHLYYMADAQRLLETGVGLLAHSVRDREVTDEFVQTLFDSGVCYVPTLMREVSTFVYSQRPDFFDDPFFLANANRREMARVTEPERMARVANSPSAAVYRKALVQAQDNLRILLGSGIPIAFGTDSGPGGRFPGYFEHAEFNLMIDAGLTPREVLRSATSTAATCLGLDDLGTLEAGKWADFVVLAENPLQDIRAMRTLQRVYVAGNRVPMP